MREEIPVTNVSSGSWFTALSKEVVDHSVEIEMSLVNNSMRR